MSKGAAQQVEPERRAERDRAGDEEPTEQSQCPRAGRAIEATPADGKTDGATEIVAQARDLLAGGVQGEWLPSGYNGYERTRGLTGWARHNR